MTWIIIFDSNTCHLYDYQKKPITLTLLKKIEHPELRLKSSEFTSDRPGHYQKGIAARGAYSPHEDPKEVEIDRFARGIAQELNRGRNEHAYHDVILIAAPHMMGLLNPHLDEGVKKLITKKLQKDLLHLNERELLDVIQTEARYPDE